MKAPPYLAHYIKNSLIQLGRILRNADICQTDKIICTLLVDSYKINTELSLIYLVIEIIEDSFSELLGLCAAGENRILHCILQGI